MLLLNDLIRQKKSDTSCVVCRWRRPCSAFTLATRTPCIHRSKVWTTRCVAFFWGGVKCVFLPLCAHLCYPSVVCRVKRSAAYPGGAPCCRRWVSVWTEANPASPPPSSSPRRTPQNGCNGAVSPCKPYSVLSFQSIVISFSTRQF